LAIFRKRIHCENDPSVEFLLRSWQKGNLRMIGIYIIKPNNTFILGKRKKKEEDEN